MTEVLQSNLGLNIPTSASRQALESKPNSVENVHTQINYEKYRDEELYYIVNPEDGVRQGNSITEAHDVLVRDLRGLDLSNFSVDKTGFQLVDDSKHDPDYEIFDSDERIQNEYYPQIEEILKEQTGGNRVFIFDHTLRRRNNGPETEINRQPVQVAHVDQTENAVIRRVQRHLGDDAEELLKHRFQLVNVWRPLFDDNTDSPLAVSDYNSINPDDDLMLSYLIYKDYKGETYRIKYNPNHKWYYVSHQNKNDVLLLKCYDSKKDVARLTPHTAFFNPKSPQAARPRESIEVRALVFHSD